MKNKEEEKSALILHKEISLKAFETLATFTIPNFFQAQKPNELKIQGLKLIVPYLRIFKNQYQNEVVLFNVLQEYKFLPELIDSLVAFFTESEEDLKIEAILAFRLVMDEFLPTSIVTKDQKFGPAI